jgi:periplasmic protein TonB
MTAAYSSRRDRAGSALGAGLVQAAFAALFLWGMGSDARQALVEPLRVFDILPPPTEPETIAPQPPPRVLSDTHNRRFTPREEGGASPPNLESRATPVVAPEPIVPLPVTPPIVSAPVAGVGADPSSGAAKVRGPGTGSGGLGNGSGSGMGGGGGGGGGYGDYSPPRRIRGRLYYSDLPENAAELGISGRVGIIYAVLASGRVTDCRVFSSSGSPMLDQLTCRLIEQRYVYEPSHDWRGRPVDSHVEHYEEWVVEDDPAPPEPPRRRRRIF